MKFLFDFLPLLLFFAAFKLYDIYVATAVAIAASIAQVSIYWIMHRRFETMHLVTLGVITVFGGLTIALRDATFIQWKPTIVSWIFAGVFFGSHWLGRKTVLAHLLGSQVSLPAPVWRRLNLGWGFFFALIGALNLYVAFYYAPDLDAAAREAIWVNFKVWGITALTLIFIVAQAFVMAPHMQAEAKASEQPGKAE